MVLPQDDSYADRAIGDGMSEDRIRKALEEGLAASGLPGVAVAALTGFLVNLEPGPAGRSAGSLAWAGLSNCYYSLDRESGVAGVMLAHLVPFADPAALSLFEGFERAVYGAALPNPRT
jgi:hypothetical protein